MDILFVVGIVLSVLLMGAGVYFVANAMAKARGRDLIGSNPDGSPSKVTETMKGVLISRPFLAGVTVIIFAMVVQLVAPAYYAKWWGGEDGWALFWATMLTVPLGTYLIHKSEGLAKAGWVLVGVGFFGPLLLATQLGQALAQKWDRIVEGPVVELSTSQWSGPYKVVAGEKLSYNRVDPKACLLVRYNRDNTLIKLIGGCSPPDEFRNILRGDIPKDSIATSIEFRAVGKPTKLEISRS